MKKRISIKKIAYLSVSVTLAMLLSFLESQIPTLVAIPGIKIGLPNVVIIFVLYKDGWKEAALVNAMRIILSSVLFGSMMSFAYSAVGGALSLTIMILLKKINKISPITVSVIGGVMHNIGQIVTAILFTATKEIAYYIPILMITGTIAGIVIGVLSGLLVKKFKNVNIY